MKRLLASGVIGLFLFTGCEGRVQDVRLAAQDFLFTPKTIQNRAGQPLRLTIANEGRETHEFSSELLTDPRVRVRWDGEAPKDYERSHSFRIPPGKSVKVTLDIPRGSYVFACKIRGHRGMTGTIQVE